MAPIDQSSAPLLTRGTLGHTPALLTRADEVYMDFVSDARNILMHAQFRNFTRLGEEALTAAEKASGKRPNSVDGVKDVILQVPEVASVLRIKRTLQEAYWRRIDGSYGLKRDAFLKALDDADTQSPGSVRWDPDFVYPEYATVDIHIQPGGYTGDPLAGLIYDYGTKVFFGGANDNDALHHRMAMKTATPNDGKIARAVEIGCSIGQLACGLKKCFSDAEVWGIDIGAPMVRYAHWRALQQNLDVHFAQMPAEAMDFPDSHFDIVTSHLLFHELPVPVIKRVLKEAHRVLRPGGVFQLWDFWSATKQSEGYASFFGMMDGADNGEPYAAGFVNCDVESLIAQAGFALRSDDPETLARDGRIGDKIA